MTKTLVAAPDDFDAGAVREFAMEAARGFEGASCDHDLHDASLAELRFSLDGLLNGVTGLLALVQARNLTIERLTVVAKSLPQLPLPALPDSMSLASRCAYEEGSDDALTAARDFFLNAIAKGVQP